MEKTRRKKIKKWIKKREKIKKRKDFKFSYKKVKKVVFPAVCLLFLVFVFFEKGKIILISEEKEQFQNQLVTPEKVLVAQEDEKPIKHEELKPDPELELEPEPTPEEMVLVEKLIAKHTITNSSSSSDRNTNMAVAASAINGETNGFILEPGEEFHWIDVVGATTSEKGYKIAGVIVHRKHSYGLGGGVCQVSSTINSAIIEAGIDTHAQKHSLPSSYIVPERGDKEATVSYDSGIDFWFENTLKFPIRIKVKTKGGAVTVKVFKRKYTTKRVK